MKTKNKLAWGEEKWGKNWFRHQPLTEKVYFLFIVENFALSEKIEMCIHKTFLWLPKMSVIYNLQEHSLRHRLYTSIHNMDAGGEGKMTTAWKLNKNFPKGNSQLYNCEYPSVWNHRKLSLTDATRLKPLQMMLINFVPSQCGLLFPFVVLLDNS